MPVFDQLITEYKAKDEHSDVVARIAGAQLGLENALSGSLGPLEAVVGSLKMMALAAGAAIVAVGALTAAIVAVSLPASRQAAEFDALAQAVGALEGSAERAGAAMKALREIAAAPGLGFEEAVRGFMLLRNQNMTAPGALRTVAAAGRANALVGGGPEQLQSILLAMSQMAGGRLSQEEINQLNTANVPGARFLRQAFGTSDTEALQRRGVTGAMAAEALVKEFEKLPSITDTAKNAFDNLGDAVKFAVVSFGQAINQSLIPFVNQFGDIITRLEAGGVFARTGTLVAEMVQALTGGGGGLEGAMVNVIAVLQTGVQALRFFYEGLRITVNQILDFVSGLPFVKDIAKMAGSAMGESPAGVFMSLLESNRSRIQRALAAAPAGKSYNADPSLPMFEDGANTSVTAPLTQIAENTRRTADALDQGRTVFGGGELGRMGLTAVEMGRGGAVADLRRQVNALADTIEVLMFQGSAAVQRAR